VLTGTFLVKERPTAARAAWVAPVYGAVMLVTLFAVLAFISLQFVGD
jgi:hypothetical protein